MCEYLHKEYQWSTAPSGKIRFTQIYTAGQKCVKGHLADVPLGVYSCQIFTRNGLSPLLVMYDTYLFPDIVSVILVWARTELNVSALTSIEKPRGSLSLEKLPNRSELRACGFIRPSASSSAALRCGLVVAIIDIRLPCTDAKWNVTYFSLSVFG